MIFTSYSTHVRALIAAIPSEGRKSYLNRIVIPVDFSECSENAIRYGLALAILSGAEITLLHGVSIPMQNADFLASPLEQMEQDARAKINATSREIAEWMGREQYPCPKINIQVKVGFIGELILELAETWKADMIVMGTHGAGRIEGFLLGSNTTHIIEKAGCAVLVVPDGAEFQGVGTVVLASDMNRLDQSVVQQVTGFAGLFGAGIDVLTVFTPDSHYMPSQVADFKKELQARFNYERLAFHIYETVLDDFTEALQTYLDENDADLVVMQMHHRSFMQKLFHGSQTKKMALQTHTPLLALHDHGQH